uniref:Uncharacterized protein n=1 Tax=Octopus bimaculoides TaxID=37653 RepID=A0A0L8FV69_OCTBM
MILHLLFGKELDKAMLLLLVLLLTTKFMKRKPDNCKYFNCKIKLEIMFMFHLCHSTWFILGKKNLQKLS